MAEEYPKEKLWKLYEVLPKELQHAIFSEETANTVFEACIKNNLEDSKISKVAQYVGDCLMGLLPPEEFEKTLKENLALSEDQAKNINHEINRFIFFPLKIFIDLLYSKKADNSSEKIEIKESILEEKISEIEKMESKQIKKPSFDVYREPIE